MDFGLWSPELARGKNVLNKSRSFGGRHMCQYIKDKRLTQRAGQVEESKYKREFKPKKAVVGSEAGIRATQRLLRRQS